MNKTKVLSSWLTIACYVLLPVAVICLYGYAKEIIIAQTAWINIIKSNFTLNIFLAFFMWGVLVDKFTKKLSKKKGWIIWGVGTAALILLFRYAGGLQTIFE